jgi:hypothetical protein
MPTRLPLLSKSRFLAGLQCPLRLWYQCYNRELATEASPSQQAIFDMGHEVGKLATRVYPGGILIGEDHLHHQQAVHSTRTGLDDLSVPAIYEAAFTNDGLRVRVDILERLGEGRWNLIEVKSSTSVKEVHVPDVAVQYHALRSLGLNIHQAGILHLNNQYVYDGRHLDLKQLFSFSDLTEEVIKRREEILSGLNQLREILKGESPPAISPSRHCLTPYPCEFQDHCTAATPEFWVVNLSGITRGRLGKLAELGVEDIRHIPGDFPLTALQARIRACLVNREEFIAPELADELRKVEYPVHFLDFETVAPAIPRYAYTRPFQTLPFQWSDHVLFEDGTLEHRQYLCNEDRDPREEFTTTLLEGLEKEGGIFIYGSYENEIITRLVEELPHHRRELLALLDRFRDLHAGIRKYFYHPEFQGSFSLKTVLPVLVPTMKYERLAIQEGSLASLEYLRMLDPSTSPKERERIKADLLAYCGHDTLGMVKIREELLGRFGK